MTECPTPEKTGRYVYLLDAEIALLERRAKGVNVERVYHCVCGLYHHTHNKLRSQRDAVPSVVRVTVGGTLVTRARRPVSDAQRKARAARIAAMS